MEVEESNIAVIAAATDICVREILSEHVKPTTEISLHSRLQFRILRIKYRGSGRAAMPGKIG